MNPIRILTLAVSLAAAGSSFAQDRGTLTPRPLPPLADPDDPSVPAKDLFGRRDRPAALPPRSIGGYARGCVAGAAAIPVDGDTWQVMRLSRNRNWGHPRLVDLLQRLAARVPQINGWPGLLVGDISQPLRTARSRTSRRLFSSASRRSKGESSSSMRPASTLERSRMSLMRASR